MIQQPETSVAQARWWEARDLAPGNTLEYQLGSLLLDIHHARGEWQLATRHVDETQSGSQPVVTQRRGGLEGESYERFLVSSGTQRLVLTPVLADRSVVIRPRQVVYLPTGEETTMYLSSPVTLRISIGEPAVTLREIQMLRLSDTWFGPSTREGELCYSGKTHARHALDEVPMRVHRAITPLHIRNNAATPLPLEKISLPVPLLSVYGSMDGRLWTQGVSLVRGTDSDMAAMKIDPVPPGYAGTVTLLSGPRQTQARGALVRTFSLLFGE